MGHDVIVVGGGHNGLTAAAYLARAGLDVCVVERRDVLGGACVTEELWPGYRVSRASYVVSMLQPKVVADLRLRDFGYEPIPLEPAYATISGGVPLFFHDDAERARASIARRSRRDADAYPAFAALLERAAEFIRPLMLRPPPALGSRRPGDLPGLVRFAGRAAGLPRRRLQELVRLMTLSVGDLLDEWFEDDELKGCLASTGVVGVWAGPRSPGTAYNLLHHALGEIDGRAGAWGHVRGGMGAISMAIARSAQAAGATIRTGEAVASIDVRDAAVAGVTLAGGEELRAPVVVSGAHPATTVLDLAGAEHFPDEVVTDMRRFRSRGGSVKVNMVLSRPPSYVGVSDEVPNSIKTERSGPTSARRAAGLAAAAGTLPFSSATISASISVAGKSIPRGSTGTASIFAPSTSISRRAPTTCSATSNSCFPTNTTSTCTTPRRNLCSPRRCAPRAMAACGCRTPISSP